MTDRRQRTVGKGLRIASTVLLALFALALWLASVAIAFAWLCPPEGCWWEWWR